MHASRLWLFIVVIGVGCTSPAPPPVRLPSAAAASAAQPADPGSTSVPWSRTFPLSWSDFKGPAPSGGIEGARTVYELNYEWQCRGTAFQYVVTAEFLPARSWVKPTVVVDPAESARVLGHEQTHFNVTEVFARRMRRYFSELYNPCAQTEEVLRTAVDRYVSDEAAMQKRYDDDTRYGLDVARQRIWERDVLGMLKELEKFGK